MNEHPYYRARKRGDRSNLALHVYRNLLHCYRRCHAGFMTGKEAADYINIVKAQRPAWYRAFIRTIRQ